MNQGSRTGLRHHQTCAHPPTHTHTHTRTTHTHGTHARHTPHDTLARHTSTHTGTTWPRCTYDSHMRVQPRHHTQRFAHRRPCGGLEARWREPRTAAWPCRGSFEPPGLGTGGIRNAANATTQCDVADSRTHTHTHRERERVQERERERESSREFKREREREREERGEGRAT